MSKSLLSRYFFLIFNLLLFLLILQPAFAVIPLETSPSWRSLESREPSIDYYSTGAVFGDIDGNGFLDLAISNGNDMYKAPNFVYFNHSGRLDTTAGWISANNEYSGHCALGDIDKDGYLELAVSN
ncbi:MAG TPA: VCBS repeat-containing protein, partial [Terriglobales bacterium]|nr:VCBS repeat-containing protein [Terriglobales bacterium]